MCSLELELNGARMLWLLKVYILISFNNDYDFSIIWSQRKEIYHVTQLENCCRVGMQLCSVLVFLLDHDQMHYHFCYFYKLFYITIDIDSYCILLLAHMQGFGISIHKINMYYFENI
jgi:hypothetical protein